MRSVSHSPSCFFVLAFAFIALFPGAQPARAGEHLSLRDARYLYVDLMRVCGEPKYARFGVALDGPYAPWRERFNALANDPGAAKAFLDATGKTYADLLELADFLKYSEGAVTSEIKVMLTPIETGLGVPPSAYTPTPELLELAGGKVDYRIEDAYGPIVPLMEGQDYWMVYLQGADASLVLQDGVVQKVLKGKRGRMASSRRDLKKNQE